MKNNDLGADAAAVVNAGSIASDAASHAEVLERLLQPYMGAAYVLNGREMSAIEAGAVALRAIAKAEGRS